MCSQTPFSDPQGQKSQFHSLFSAPLSKYFYYWLCSACSRQGSSLRSTPIGQQLEKLRSKLRMTTSAILCSRFVVRMARTCCCSWACCCTVLMVYCGEGGGVEEKPGSSSQTSRAELRLVGRLSIMFTSTISELQGFALYLRRAEATADLATQSGSGMRLCTCSSCISSIMRHMS